MQTDPAQDVPPPSAQDATSATEPSKKLYFGDMNPEWSPGPNTPQFVQLQKIVKTEADIRANQEKASKSKETIEEELHALKHDLKQTSAQLYFHKYKPEELEAYMSRLFKLGDTNENGIMEKEELVALLNLSHFPFDLGNVEELLDKYDINRNGVIEKSEFMTMIGAHIRGEEHTADLLQKPKVNDPAPWADVGEEYGHMSSEDAEFMRNEDEKMKEAKLRSGIDSALDGVFASFRTSDAGVLPSASSGSHARHFFGHSSTDYLKSI